MMMDCSEKWENSANKEEKETEKNFYTFQIEEGKMKNLGALRKNYEEAKKKVEQLQSFRRFKLY